MSAPLASKLAGQARARLETFRPRAETLRASVDFVLERRY
jgi:hypothetical protein